MQQVQWKQKLLVGLVGAIVGIGATTFVARAEESVCTSSLGAVTVDNLKVPSGASCTLSGTRVQGTIVVESNATLNASGVDVIGNIQAEGAAAVNVTTNSRVGGSIQVKQGSAAAVRNTDVTGDIQFESNRGALVAANNRTGGSIQVFQNTGGVDIANNTVDGNLQCKENQPPPTGGNNTVQGSKEDQCANLNPPVPPAGGAGDVVCTAALGPVTVDNVTVPANRQCSLTGTIVRGHITVEQGATLNAAAILVVGNIEATGAAAVHIASAPPSAGARTLASAQGAVANNEGSAIVSGSIRIKQGSGATISSVIVGGSIHFEANSGVIEAAFNQTRGDLQALRNTGPIQIVGNIVDGNLLCQANSAGLAGGGNAVAGSEEGQCAQLDAEKLFLPVLNRQ